MSTPTALRRVATVRRPEAEEQGAEDQEVLEADVQHEFSVARAIGESAGSSSGLSSLRAMTTAPIRVASRTSEATSKGSSQRVRNASPMSRWSGPAAAGTCVAPGGGQRHEDEHRRRRRAKSATPPPRPRLRLETFTSRDAAGEHHREEDQHQDAADVDEQLGHRDEVGREEDVERARPEQGERASPMAL